jgi:energy-coupling factor transporter ATP-binding protein EcfA2
VDVGARHDLIDAIREAAARGCGVIIASIDAVDLAVLCDRVLVFRDGQVAAELSGNLDQDDIVHATFGGALLARGDDHPRPAEGRLGGDKGPPTPNEPGETPQGNRKAG